MANDKKWTYLAELAYLHTDWKSIVDDILEAITKIKIVNDKEATVNESDDSETLEENFDL